MNKQIHVDGTLQQRAIAPSRITLFIAVGVLAMAAMAIYLTVRVAVVVEADYTGADVVVTLLLLLAEAFILLHAFGYMLSVIRALRPRPEVKAAVLKEPEDFPAVDVLMAARHESREVLERTLTALRGMSYPNMTVWFLDDSSEKKYMDEAAELAETYGCKLFRREERRGAKAGIINDCLKQLTGEYIAVFDADQSPMPFFLNRIVPLLVADPALAFVQTPQFYSNTEENRVARASGSQQAVFYEYICEAKAASGTAFCCGTNVVFRREALMQVGGLDETSVTEDFATSVQLHARGWKSLYYGQAYVMGYGPETLLAYFRQQFRWARGTLGVGARLFKMFLRHPGAMTPWQWVDYLLSGSYYLVGWAYLVLIACPTMYVLFGVPTYFVRPEIYAIAFLPYLVFSALMFVGGLWHRHYTFGQLVSGQLLGLLATPIHILASLAVLFGAKSNFGITPKGVSDWIPLRKLWPQLILCVGSFVAFVWGACRFIFEKDAAAGINAFWAGIHFFVFWSVFFFQEALPQDGGNNPELPEVKAT